MPADVCPVTRFRCSTVDQCTTGKCWRSTIALHPIPEARLTKQEQYWLNIKEARAKRAAEAEGNG